MVVKIENAGGPRIGIEQAVGIGRFKQFCRTAQAAYLIDDDRIGGKDSAFDPVAG